MERILIGCAAMVLLAQAIHPASVAAQEVAVSYRIEPARSAIYVVTHRTGLLSFLGHDHAILATEWSGALCWAPDVPRQGHGTVEVAAGALVIDTDTARAVAGLRGDPSPGQMRELQEKLLDPDHLDAARYPVLTLSVDRLAESIDDGLVAHGRLRIRDRVRDVEFPLQVAAAPDSVRFSGVLRVPQTSFGIRPESVAAVVKVADVVDIHFDLLGVSTRVPCSDRT
jgi:polyisoprenoid-binding protein YceI